MGGAGFVSLVIVVGFGISTVPAAEAAGGEVCAARALWAPRAAGADGAHARLDHIEPIIARLRGQIEAHPDSLGPRCRLVRALFFKAEYVLDDAAEKKRVFDEGKHAGEDALALIRRRAGAAAGKDLANAAPVDLVTYVHGDEDVLECFSWSGANWGKWALVYDFAVYLGQSARACTKLGGKRAFTCVLKRYPNPLLDNLLLETLDKRDHVALLGVGGSRS